MICAPKSQIFPLVCSCLRMINCWFCIYWPIFINVLVIRIENNHFTCECDKMSWFLGAMTKNFDTDVIANGRGSLDFLRFFKTTFSKNTFAIFPTHEKLVTVLLVHRKNCTSAKFSLNAFKYFWTNLINFEHIECRSTFYGKIISW